jgi:hypothetical protein
MSNNEEMKTISSFLLLIISLFDFVGDATPFVSSSFLRNRSPVEK